MGFELLPALAAGFVGTVVMTAMMSMAKTAGMTEMDMLLIQGAMVTGDRAKAKLIGLFTHVVMIGAIVFGSLYAILFSALDVSEGDAWWVGAVIGAAHGVVAGVAMAMMPAMHPRMGGQPRPGDPGVHLAAPGPFAKNYGPATPAGLVMVHVAFGLVLGLVYGWLV